MEESVKKELEKNINAINSNLNLVINTENLMDQLIKLAFDNIRNFGGLLRKIST
jgi:hypothetical protein